MLFIDIETYSSVNLPKCGVHRYVNDPSWAEALPLEADGYECAFYKKA